MLGLGDQRREVEHLEHALEAHQRGHHLDPGRGQRRQRRVEAGEQQRERDDVAGVERTRQREPAAQAVDQRQRERRDQRQRRDEHPLHHRGAHADVAYPRGAGDELAGLVRGPPEQLHERGARRGEPLGHLGAHGRVVVGGLPVELGEAAAHPLGGQHEDRQQDQRQHRDLPGQAEHHDQGQRERDDVADHARERVGERPLRPDHVVVEAADQRARPRAGEERHRLALHVVEHGGAQVEDEALAERRGEPALHDPDARLRDRDGRDGERDADDHRRGPAADDRVHDAARQYRRRHRQPGAEHAEREERADPPSVGTREATDPGQGGPGERPSLVGTVRRLVHLVPGDHLHAHARTVEPGVGFRSRRLSQGAS